MLVIAERIGGQRAAPAAAAHPQDQVDVLPVGEQPLVEAARVEERRAVEGRGGGRRPDRIGDLAGEHRQRLAVQVVEDQERAVELHAGAVDQRAVAPVAHHPRRHRDPGPGVDPRAEPLDEARIADAVVVEQDEDLAVGALGAEVHRAGEAGVVVEAQHVGARQPLGGGRDRVALRAVVDDDRLVRDGLRGERLEHPPEPLPGHGRDDDGRGDARSRRGLGDHRAAAARGTGGQLERDGQRRERRPGERGERQVAAPGRAIDVAEVALERPEGHVALAGEAVEQRLPHAERILLDERRRAAAAARSRCARAAPAGRPA